MAEVVAHSGLLTKTMVHVEDTGGTGRPVVLIHGWPLSSASWNDQIPVLQAAGYRVVAYDRRGFGQSDKPAHGFDYDTLAEDLDGVLSELDLHDVTLVGFSMGGGEVARSITKHGVDRIHSVVFASAVPPYLMQTEQQRQQALALCKQADKKAALACMAAFATTDFREDLPNVVVPTLVIHAETFNQALLDFLTK